VGVAPDSTAPPHGAPPFFREFLNGDGTCDDVVADTNTNAQTQCTTGEFLDGDGGCVASADIGVDTNTNAQTQCDAGSFLDGDGGCVASADIGVDTNTNAQTQCTTGEFLDGDGGCVASADIGVDTNTNAATICSDGSFLNGDGSCDASADIGTNTNADTMCTAGQFLNGDGTCDAVVVNTNAATECDTDEFLNGDGSCDSSVAPSDHNHSADDITSDTLAVARYNSLADLVAAGHLNNDADTDLLLRLQADGRYAASGAGTDAGDITEGTLSTSRYDAYDDLSVAGYLNNDADTDLLLRSQADARYAPSGAGTDADLITSGTLNNARYDSYGELRDAGRLDNNHRLDLLTREQLAGRFARLDTVGGFRGAAPYPDPDVCADDPDGDNCRTFPLTATLATVRSVTVRPPTSGYFIVNASGTLLAFGVDGSYVLCSLTTIDGENDDAGQFIYYSADVQYIPFATTRYFEVAANINYTFRLNCEGVSISIFNTHINALFVPTWLPSGSAGEEAVR
jgi:hypothetical protein